MSQFHVSKSLIEAYVNNGLTVKQMAADITAKSGTYCSSAVIRSACKTYGINLRTKRMPNKFIFDDLTSVSIPPVVGEAPTHTATATSAPVYVREEATVQL